MERRKVVGWGVVVVVLAALCVAGAPGTALAANPDPEKLLQESKKACVKIKDFTAVFAKAEQIDGSLRKTETVKMKFRAAPFSVYMHWFQDPHKGREVIYQAGKYEGKIVGHQPIGPLNFSKRAKPDSADALKHSRRPITQAGFANAIRLICEKTALGKKRNEMLITYLGTEIYDSRPVHVICRVFTAKRDDYPIYILMLYIDKQLLIPVKVCGYDWDHKLLGLYAYTNVKLNVGLTDTDFEIKNKEYDFPGVLPFGKMKLPWPFEDKKDKK